MEPAHRLGKQALTKNHRASSNNRYQGDDVEEPSQHHLIGMLDLGFRCSEIAGPSGLSRLTINPHLVVVPSLFTGQHMFFLFLDKSSLLLYNSEQVSNMYLGYGMSER